MIASLPTSLSISQPALTYLTKQAHRREITSKEMLIAFANVTGQEVTDYRDALPLYLPPLLIHPRIAIDLKALRGALFFINLNVSTCVHVDTLPTVHQQHGQEEDGGLGWKCEPVSGEVVISVMVSCCDTLSLAHWLLWSDSISASMTVGCSAIS